ncbi:hypothetical protein THRCLA_08336 [Thraustotheca clavata]|uniref:Uncharacterized protein n=1 Tax=Thraustotheca clavata TaxID=74557 RepID=A0A1V9Z777_9STRA|nr:hypothetical protein THRCLA_08336 [Thraustotheca clavata]
MTTSSRLIEVLVFSWHHFLSPTEYLERHFEHRFPLLSTTINTCRQMDRHIVQILTHACQLGYVYVVVESSFDAFELQLNTYFPRTARWLEMYAAALPLEFVFDTIKTTKDKMYDTMLRAIWQQTREYGDIGLTIFGPEALQQACARMSNIFSIVPKTINSTEQTSSLQHILTRLLNVDANLNAIVQDGISTDMSIHNIEQRIVHL